MLAHADLEKISQDSLWAITRGLEDFNNTVNTISLSQSEQAARNDLSTLHQSTPHHMIGLTNRSSFSVVTPMHSPLLKGSLEQDAILKNSYRNLSDSIKPVPFIKVLSILAKERSKYTAIMTHHLITSNEDFLRLAYTAKRTDFSWSKDMQVSGAVKWQSDKSGQQQVINTSDYHSGTGSSISNSHSSGGSLPRVGKILVPTITKDAESIREFADRESEFAAKFLQIVCHSTKFVKRVPNGRHFKIMIESGSPSKSPTKLKAPTGLHLTPTPSMDMEDSPSPSRASNHGIKHDQDNKSANKKPKKVSKLSPHFRTESPERSSGLPTVLYQGEEGTSLRKSVSWGDSADYSVMVQLTQKYMDLLWQHLGNHFSDFLHVLAWGGVDSVRDSLGSILHCHDAVTMLVSRMMSQLSTHGRYFYMV